MKWFLIRILCWIFLGTLPFILLIRGAVYTYEHYHISSWLSILVGIILCTLVLFVYAMYWRGRLIGNLGSTKSAKWTFFIIAALILMNALPGIFYLSTQNAKHADIPATYYKLHPILRLGVSGLIFLDNGLIITDSDRVPEDYKKMGLPTNKHSLHYVQSSGYVHAIDIRTNGRSFVRNNLIQLYFWGMGFNTLRHVGTDDHLHVSISSKDKPGGI